MSKSEITGKRDLTYSRWHRQDSIARFVGDEKAKELTTMDVDFVEYDNTGLYPVALVETAIDNGNQDDKYVRPFRRLAETVDVPAYLVLHKISERQNPVDPNYRDIEEFRVKMVFPVWCSNFIRMTPKEWAEHLCELRKIRNSRFEERESKRAKLVERFKSNDEN